MMSITVPVTFTADADEWAREYGLNDAAAARVNFTEYVSGAVISGDLVAVIEATWPALGGKVTSAVPAAILAAVQWTPELVAAAVAALRATGADGWDLRQALAASEDSDHMQEVHTIVRDHVGPDAVAVLFFPNEWDNGHYLHDLAVVVSRDGSTESVEFPGVGELFTEVYGRVGESAGLAIIPATGEEEFADSAAEYLLADWIAARTGISVKVTTAAPTAVISAGD